MCVTFCHRNLILFFNHSDCPPQLCPVGADIPGTCADCRHRQGKLCGLTRAPLPVDGGCCHWNVALVTDRQLITPARCELLGPGANETVADLLTGLDAPCHVDDAGRTWVNPDALGLPDIYGRGSDEI